MKKLLAAVTVLAVAPAQAGVVIHVDASNWPLTGGTSKGGPGGGSRDAGPRRGASVGRESQDRCAADLVAGVRDGGRSGRGEHEVGPQPEH